jgi:peptidyl-tRNA hydrolase ICT1
MIQRQAFTRLVGLKRMPSQVTVTPFAPRFKRYQAFDADLDKDALTAARSWYESFNASQLPKGNTTYARSSGPGGQHVNKYV